MVFAACRFCLGTRSFSVSLSGPCMVAAESDGQLRGIFIDLQLSAPGRLQIRLRKNLPSVNAERVTHRSRNTGQTAGPCSKKLHLQMQYLFV